MVDTATAARRSLPELTELLVTYAHCVDALSPEAWERLRARCRPIAGSTPETLSQRAQLWASPLLVSWPAPRNAPVWIRALPTLANAFAFTMGLSLEVVQSAFPWTVDPVRPERTTTTGKPHVDRYIDAHHMIERAL